MKIQRDVQAFLLICCTIFVASVSSSKNFASNIERSYRKKGTPMHKVLLTQRGYIQFLRWELPVPEIREFTFCLWVTSNNLTHPHSIFSYSKDEKERLIRSWISTNGRSVHLEIGGVEVFNRPTDITENRWYHICQSWESYSGRYALWINDRIEVQGQAERTINHVVKSGGDIVLGQEYTDFDKGLEEGVEGAVLGFNLLLASAFSPLDHAIVQESAVRVSRIPHPSKTVKFVDPMSLPLESSGVSGSRRLRFRSTSPAELSRNFPTLRGGPRATKAIRFSDRIPDDEIFRKTPRRGAKSLPEIGDFAAEADGLQLSEPLGMQLVKLSYVRCEIGRGSPHIGGSLMLISWSRTPVRVFGGAMVKNVPSDCGRF